MIGRRPLLAGAAATLAPRPPAVAQAPWPHWLGAYAGVLQFYRSVWIFDAGGTRARTWRGTAVRRH